MDKAARTRWAILLLFLGGTVGAIYYPIDDLVIPRAGSLPNRLPISAVIPSAAELEQWQPLLVDPFSPRHWEPPSPIQAVPQLPVVAAAAVAAPLPVAPPLPFQFVGQMNDGVDQVVYLVRGDAALLARTGELLEGTYKVLEISPLQIEFEHLPTGQKQTLVFPAKSN